MKSQSKRKSVAGLTGWLLASFAVSAIGALASVQAKSFYGQLDQPAWAPPPSVFGPVWTLLFVMMAVAAWLVWRSGGFRANAVALSVYVVQLGLNALWSWLFFAWNRGAMALVDIALLWLAIVVTLVLFWRVRPLAGLLLVPYLLWVSFAAALSYTLWQLNPDVLADVARAAFDVAANGGRPSALSGGF